MKKSVVGGFSVSSLLSTLPQAPGHEGCAGVSFEVLA